MSVMRTLYVGCALRGAPAEFVASVEALKRELEQYFEVLHFVGLSPTASAREIYKTDIDHATKADLMLAIADQPSTGLGMEIAKRTELGKPTIIAYHQTKKISAMVLGIKQPFDNVEIIPYESHEEVLEYMKDLLPRSHVSFRH
jgi:hypothetical protein